MSSINVLFLDSDMPAASSFFCQYNCVVGKAFLEQLLQPRHLTAVPIWSEPRFMVYSLRRSGASSVNKPNRFAPLLGIALQFTQFPRFSLENHRCGLVFDNGADASKFDTYVRDATGLLAIVFLPTANALERAKQWLASLWVNPDYSETLATKQQQQQQQNERKPVTVEASLTFAKAVMAKAVSVK
jgi:hypothetical protein